MVTHFVHHQLYLHHQPHNTRFIKIELIVVRIITYRILDKFCGRRDDERTTDRVRTANAMHETHFNLLFYVTLTGPRRVSKWPSGSTTES